MVLRILPDLVFPQLLILPLEVVPIADCRLPLLGDLPNNLKQLLVDPVLFGDAAAHLSDGVGVGEV